MSEQHHPRHLVGSGPGAPTSSWAASSSTGGVGEDTTAAGLAAQRELDVLATYPGAERLRGPWRLRLDRGNVGKAEAWYDGEPPDEAITVAIPSCWQEYVDYPGGVAWYFKDIVIPADMRDQALFLKFWAVDYFSEVWLNGQFCGSHEGGYTPFELDITAAARLGQDNRLAVRVVDPPRPPHPADGHLWQDTAQTTPASADGFNLLEIPMGLQAWIEGLSFGGIWQPVELLNRPRLHISDVFLEPHRTAGAVDAHVQITNMEATATVTMRVTVTPWQLLSEVAGETAQIQTCAMGVTAVDLRLAIQAPRAWSVEDPYLYLATITVEHDGQSIHQQSVRFGLRDFTVADGSFHLNGRRIVVKGGHYQGAYPTTLAFPPTRAFAYRDMQLMKEAGFNFVRLWGKPTPAWVLDAADELGLLLQEEPPLSVMRDSDQMLPRALREVSELIARDRNRPSIVIWNMINELAPATTMAPQLCRAARVLDPTRLITENNGGHSRYYLPYAEDGISYLTEHSYPGAPVGEDVLDYWRRRGTPGGLFFVSEYGFGGMDDVDAVLAWYGPQAQPQMEDYRGYVRLKELRDEQFVGSVWERTFGSMARLRAAAQEMQAEEIRLHTEALRANPACGGLNLVQLIDSNAYELDGIVDFVRQERKAAFAEMQRLNGPLALIVHCAPRNLRSSEGVRVMVTLVNEDHLQGRAELAVQVRAPMGTTVVARKAVVEVQSWVLVIFDELVPVPGPSGRYTIEAVLRQEGRVRAEGSRACTVVHPADIRWPARPCALFDPEGQLGPFLEERNVEFVAFDPQSARPVAVVVAPFAIRALEPRDYQALLRVFEIVERGGTALFLELPRSGEGMATEPIWDRGHGMLSVVSLGGVFPFRVTSHAARWHGRVGPYSWGLQAPLAGAPAPDHPIFDGLPHGLMGAPYANVVPLHEITTDVRPAEDVGVVQVYTHGDGAIILSSFNLLPYLRTDALAEKLLANLVGYTDQLLRPALAAPRAATREAIASQERQYEDIRAKFPVRNSATTGRPQPSSC